MLLLNRGQSAQFKFIFVSEGNIYDPTNQSTPTDIYFYIIRGETSGPIIDGPFSYLNQEETPTSSIYIEKNNEYEFILNYVIPNNLFSGTYSVIAQTNNGLSDISLTSSFQIRGEPITLNPTILSSDKSVVINYKASYEDLNKSNTQTLLLLGHADGLGLNNPIKIRSIQNAIDLLGADMNSPLLRGVFNAYEAGARDIIICAVAPMSEYVDRIEDRNISTEIFDLSAPTPTSYTFYEKYYERLSVTYSILEQLDFIDIIVPLEISFINTGGVDFLTQLANYLADFHNTTGYVQIGIIGSRSNGIKSSDIDILESDVKFTNKFTQYSLNGFITSDKGRFVIPVYGEGVFQHAQLKTGYKSSIAASFAGLMSSHPLNLGLIRTRIPGVTSVFGSDLSQSDYSRLDALGVNSIYRGKKTRRAIPFEVYITNEYTMAHPNSTLSKAAQMRIVARIVSEVKGYAYEGIGKFGYDKVVDNVRNFLEKMKQDRIIIDFSFKVEAVKNQVGSLIFYIEIVSSLGLKKVNFAISAGPGV